MLSATEGLIVAAPWLEPFTVPITIAILVGLSASAHGNRIGCALRSNHADLVPNAWDHGRYPNPPRNRGSRGHQSLLRTTVSGLARCGRSHCAGCVFSTTGAEALYADLGHFGRKPIGLAWHSIVFPSLILNYLGQGALVLRDPTARENPFFHMAPSWMLWPLIALATVAAVIASQALISGAFSLTMQSVHMGYTPFINIRHTSHEEHGQVYIPQINTLLAVGCIALVLGFRSSAALASAYGIAVTLTMIATTLLLYFAAQRVWKWSPPARWRSALPFFSLN